MHYIIGAKILLKKTVARPGAQQSFNRANRNFKFDTIYTLSNIKRVDEGVKYTFSSAEGPAEIIFKNSNEADAYIAKLRNEELPNYEKFYQNWKA